MIVIYTLIERHTIERLFFRWSKWVSFIHLLESMKDVHRAPYLGVCISDSLVYSRPITFSSKETSVLFSRPNKCISYTRHHIENARNVKTFFRKSPVFAILRRNHRYVQMNILRYTILSKKNLVFSQSRVYYSRCFFILSDHAYRTHRSVDREYRLPAGDTPHRRGRCLHHLLFLSGQRQGIRLGVWLRGGAGSGIPVAPDSPRRTDALLNF